MSTATEPKAIPFPAQAPAVAAAPETIDQSISRQVNANVQKSLELVNELKADLAGVQERLRAAEQQLATNQGQALLFSQLQQQGVTLITRNDLKTLLENQQTAGEGNN